MNCDYCGGQRSWMDRTCPGCGATVATVTDMIKTGFPPEHWINSFQRTALRVVIASIGVGVVIGLLKFLKLELPAVIIIVLWCMSATPGLLFVSAWRDARHGALYSGRNRPLAFIGNAAMALFVWGGSGISLFVASSPFSF